MKLIQCFLLGASISLASGCVYRINIQQGNFLDQAAVDTVKPGMTRSQVRYLLGTPMVADSFDKERWDYIYYLKKGRSRHVDSRRVTVYFEGDKVAHEHIYWDQASVLVQVGLLDRTLPVLGGETAAQVLNPTQSMNELIRRASNRTGGDSPA